MSFSFLKLFRKKHPSYLKLARKAGVQFGDNTTFASCFWSEAEPFLIKIGSNCQITHGVKIFTHGGSQVARMKFPKFDCFGRVIIGNNVYIGNNALIMPGVTVEDNVLIAAGSVVCRSIPSGSVVGGNPARFICTVDDYVKKNNQYNLDSKGLTRSAKKRLLLSADESWFIKKGYMNTSKD